MLSPSSKTASRKHLTSLMGRGTKSGRPKCVRGCPNSVRVLYSSCPMVNELLVMSENRLTLVSASNTACPSGVLILSTPSDVRYSSKLSVRHCLFPVGNLSHCVLPAESPSRVASKTFQVYLNCPSHVQPGLLLGCPKSVRAVHHPMPSIFCRR